VTAGASRRKASTPFGRRRAPLLLVAPMANALFGGACGGAALGLRLACRPFATAALSSLSAAAARRGGPVPAVCTGWPATHLFVAGGVRRLMAVELAGVYSWLVATTLC